MDFFECVEQGDEEIWILRSKSRHEKKIETILNACDVPVYLPLYKKKMRRRAGAGKIRNYESENVLFPGYVFCVNPGDFYERLLVGNAIASTLKVPETERALLIEELKKIQLMLYSSSDILAHDELQLGKVATIVNGSLKGLVGQIIKVKSKHRFVLNVKMLSRSISLEIDGVDIQVEEASL